MLRIIENRNTTLACGFERRPGAWWLFPVIFVKKFLDEKPVTVFSVLVGWGWDNENPLSLKMRMVVRHRDIQSPVGPMKDHNVTAAWCGFSIVVHMCVQPDG